MGVVRATPTSCLFEQEETEQSETLEIIPISLFPSVQLFLPLLMRQPTVGFQWVQAEAGIINPCSSTLVQIRRIRWRTAPASFIK